MTISEYNKIVDFHADSLFRFLLKSTKSKYQAEDLVQESFTRLWENIRNIEFETAKSYLFKIGYNCMINFFREENKKTKIENSYFKTDVNQSDVEWKDLLDYACSKLPDIQRIVMLLRDYEGYSYQEIGQITNLSESQVKVYIFRARTSLKEFLMVESKMNL